MNCDCKTVGEHFRVCRGVDYNEVIVPAWKTLLNLQGSTKEEKKHLEKHMDLVKEAIEMKL